MAKPSARLSSLIDELVEKQPVCDSSLPISIRGNDSEENEVLDHSESSSTSPEKLNVPYKQTGHLHG